MRTINHTNFVVIDVETTGFSHQDRVIEIALITLDSETLKIVEEYDSLINPERDISATKIHGITASMVKSAPTFADLAPVIAHHLDGAIPVAHNWPFDKRMLSNEFARLGNFGNFGQGFCTYQYTKLNLELACKEYNVKHFAHRALGDARATADIFAQLCFNNVIDFSHLEPSSIIARG